jgi:hypothetical protein
MTRLSPEARELLRVVREADGATGADRARVHGRLAPTFAAGLATGAVAATTSAAASASVTAGGAAAGPGALLGLGAAKVGLAQVALWVAVGAGTGALVTASVHMLGTTPSRQAPSQSVGKGSRAAPPHVVRSEARARQPVETTCPDSQTRALRTCANGARVPTRRRAQPRRTRTEPREKARHWPSRRGSCRQRKKPFSRDGPSSRCGCSTSTLRVSVVACSWQSGVPLGSWPCASSDAWTRPGPKPVPWRANRPSRPCCPASCARVRSNRRRRFGGPHPAGSKTILR